MIISSNKCSQMRSRYFKAASWDLYLGRYNGHFFIRMTHGQCCLRTWFLVSFRPDIVELIWKNSANVYRRDG